MPTRQQQPVRQRVRQREAPEEQRRVPAVPGEQLPGQVVPAVLRQAQLRERAEQAVRQQ